MKHGVKEIKNKMFLCKGCGGIWGLENISKESKFFDQVSLNPSDKTQFIVSHRVVGNTSFVAA